MRLACGTTKAPTPLAIRQVFVDFHILLQRPIGGVAGDHLILGRWLAVHLGVPPDRHASPVPLVVHGLRLVVHDVGCGDHLPVDIAPVIDPYLDDGVADVLKLAPLDVAAIDLGGAHKQATHLT